MAMIRGNDLLKSFWEWMYFSYGVSYERYTEKGLHQPSGQDECEFPHFHRLINYAESIIESNKVDEGSIDDLLTILALDNEAENILGLIVERSSNEQLKSIIFYGIKHPLFNARWQLAEIINRRKPDCYKEYLLTLSRDPHQCVKRRAVNCLNYMGLNLS